MTGYQRWKASVLKDNKARTYTAGMAWNSYDIRLREGRLAGGWICPVPVPLHGPVYLSGHRILAGLAGRCRQSGHAAG